MCDIEIAELGYTCAGREEKFKDSGIPQMHDAYMADPFRSGHESASLSVFLLPYGLMALEVFSGVTDCKYV